MNASVCIATYNGERYIFDQLISILKQLDENDEIIIVDDASIDNTISIIEEIDDKRINLSKSSKNKGHVKSFEKAISLANKDIILLADQDDIWQDNKLKTIKHSFKENPKIKLIYHGLELVDKNLNHLEKKYANKKTTIHNGFVFALSHVWKGRIFGCASAFRFSLKKSLLPIPKYIVAHDHWLGIAGGMNSNILELSDCLVLYRQHDKNLTAKKFNLFRSLKAKLVNLIAILNSIIRIIQSKKDSCV